MTNENAVNMVDLNDLVDLKTYAKSNDMDIKRLRRYARKLGDAARERGIYQWGKRGNYMVDKNALIVLPVSTGRGGGRKRDDGRQRYVVYATQSEIAEIDGWAVDNVTDPRERAKTRRDAKREIAAMATDDVAYVEHFLGGENENE